MYGMITFDRGAEIDQYVKARNKLVKRAQDMENGENEIIRCFISNNGKTKEINGYRYNVKAYHTSHVFLHDDDCLNFRVFIEKKEISTNRKGNPKTEYIVKKSLIMDYYQVKLLKSQLPEEFID